MEWCAGYCGIGLGLKRVFGERLRTIAYCELEGFAQANIVSKMEAGLLDVAPLWSDLKTFPCTEFHGLVDILVAGYPCQPFSAAGKRQGENDPRHLWPYIRSAIGTMEPGCVFLENVEGHISLGLSTVISDLEELGYKVSWGIFSASEVGAPHQRKRVFILAYKQCEGLEGSAVQSIQRSVCGFAGNGSAMADSILRGASGSRNELGNAGEIGQGRTHLETHSHTSWPSRPGEQQFAWEPPRVVANANNAGWETRRDNSVPSEGGESYEPASCESNIGESEAMGNASQLFSDGCDDHARSCQRSEEVPESGDASWEAMGHADHGRLASGINSRSGAEADRGGQGDIEPADGGAMGNAESKQGASRNHRQESGSTSEPQQVESRGGDCRSLREGNGETQPPLGRDADGPAGGMGYAELCVTCDNRTDELRLLGNGVVPATAERAFLTLMEEINK